MDEPVDLRILQANERTMLAWVRTGLTLMAFGFVIARLSLWLRLMVHSEDRGASLALGIGVIAIGAACHVIGAVRFVAARRALLAGRTIVPGATGPVVIALVVAGIGVALIAYLLAT